MPRRVILRFGLLAVFCVLSCALVCNAQSPNYSGRCPQPVPREKEIIAWRKAVIERIEFDGPIHLLGSEIAEIVKDENRSEIGADRPDLIKDDTEFALRSAWQDHGYFKVNLTANARSLGSDANEERFLVTGHVEEGLQYRLKGIRFRRSTDNALGGDLAIPEAEVRAAIPIRDGDIFNVALIRKGVQELTKLYGSKGYIDFTAVPDTEVNDDPQPWISLVFALDLQKQFRVGKVEIVGLDPKLGGQLAELVRPGNIFVFDVIYDFFNKNKALLPNDISIPNAMWIQRNVRAGTVDLAFDFSPCP